MKRCETGIPSRVIRFSTAQPTRASVLLSGQTPGAKTMTDNRLVGPVTAKLCKVAIAGDRCR